MNKLVKPLAWEQDENDWVAKSVAGPFRISKNIFGNWSMTWRDQTEHHWDLECLKNTASREYAAHIQAFLQEPAPTSKTYTVILNRDSGYDSRRGEYHPGEQQVFVTRNLDEAVAKGFEAAISNLEGQHYNDTDQSLLIDGLHRDDLWLMDEDEDAREAVELRFHEYDQAVAEKVRDYKDNAAERKRKKDEADRLKADADRIARFNETETRERQMLDELRKKYPDA